MSANLPPLPEPHSTRKVWVDGIPSHLFTAEQMFAFRARGLAAQATEVEALRDELRLCCELKREYQAQVASNVDEIEALRAALRAMLDDDDHDAAKSAARAVLKEQV